MSEISLQEALKNNVTKKLKQTILKHVKKVQKMLTI